MSRGFSDLAYAGFDAIFRPWMSRRIAGVSVVGLPEDVEPDRPLVLVANHVSWWDGFLLMQIRRSIRPRAPFHTVMLQSELQRSRFLRRIGAIGIEPSSPGSVIHAVRELSERTRSRPDSVIFFFPQGRIWPSHRRPLGFKRGIEVFTNAIGSSTLLPVGIHFEPLTKASPQAFVSVGDPIPSEDKPSARDLEHAVEAQLDELLGLIERHGEDVLNHHPFAVNGPHGSH
ncbi:MAG: lysophospholipid acyltransferase family protein [Gemmatimonadaceae bacterium]